jgi:hypothetical protein
MCVRVCHVHCGMCGCMYICMCCVHQVGVWLGLRRSAVKAGGMHTRQSWLMAKSMVKMETFSCGGSNNLWSGARGHEVFVCVLTGNVVAWVMCLWAIKAGL